MGHSLVAGPVSQTSFSAVILRRGRKMTISKDLFLAILSMDAYNRGYALGINLPGNDALGTAIGNATIYKSKGDSEAISAGFYALAYDMSAVSGFSAGDRACAEVV